MSVDLIESKNALHGIRTIVEQNITFGAGGNATDHQLYGWSIPETGFTWTDGISSSLLLNRPSGRFGAFIEILATPYFAQHIVVRINGRRIGETTVAHATVLAYYFEPTNEMKLVLTFELPDARLPDETVAHPRRIAFAVHSVVVSSLIEPYRDVHSVSSGIDLAASDDSGALSAAQAITGLSPMALATQFENLIGNCEFGFFQRKCGAEPLSLLKFTNATPQSVYRGLNTNFAGLADDLRMEPAAIGNEWMTFDPGYRFSFHTFVGTDEVTSADMGVREAKRLRYLRRKFLEDVGASRKIFVCTQMREPQQPYLPEEIMALMLALNRRAPNTLLFVTQAVSRRAPGSVEMMMPDVLRGNIRHLAPPSNPGRAPLTAWLGVCVNAWLMCRNQMEAV